MRKRLRFVMWCVLAAGAAVIGSSSAAEAGSKNYIAVLNAGQEVPPLNRPGTGNGFLRYDPTTGQLCWTVSYEGLAGNETVSHIHGPAAPGTDASVVVDISVPSGSGKQGCAVIDKDTAKALNQGLLYINIHSDAGPAEQMGELRGQIIPVKGK